MTHLKHEVSEQVANFAHIDVDKYRRMYARSIESPEEFWAEKAKKYLTWFKHWDSVLAGSFEEGNVRWFTGGKLNVCFNCLDRHLATLGDRPAIIWEGDSPHVSQTLTYKDLHDRVCRFANVLKRFGIKKGDRICIYLPMIPEAAIAMLAATRIGAIHTVVFGGFSHEALKARILDANCKLVITANEGLRGTKKVPLKQQVDEALKSCKDVKTVIVVKRTETYVAWNHERDYWYHDVISQSSDECRAEFMDANDPLFILYTSGSTGKPKGIVHSTAGYLLYAAITHRLVFDYHKREVFWCTADVGWVTGHTYGIYGPLANGATTLMYEGVPDYPTPSRFWEIIDKHKVNIFYTAPTAIRALRRQGDKWLQDTKRNSLRIIGTVGEPINMEAWEWYDRVVGKSRCTIVDTWWQTETGATMIAPLPGATPLKPGFASWPFFGIQPKIIDENGNEVPRGTMGRLIIQKPWPGMMLTINNDHERFMKDYFSQVKGAYLTGDEASCDEDGYFWIAGRSDDVIKVSGHRIGTQDVESAILEYPAVAEAAVVPIPDEIKGQNIYAFVCLKVGMVGNEKIIQEIKQTVRDVIGPIATPHVIHIVEHLPKTRSGKIMRRLLKKIAVNDIQDLGDVSTLLDVSVVDELIKSRSRMTNNQT